MILAQVDSKVCSFSSYTVFSSDSPEGEHKVWQKVQEHTKIQGPDKSRGNNWSQGSVVEVKK